ncbi:MAG: aminotransferase class V-fold PLP-dependent enzyme [Chlamydiales bacterium]|nr:cysteine desulfurase [Chlamydiales bacterium]NCF70293.1 aminotransferase class V-fold PLP-dependent enzyme [Chlamydiales bacterium]
MERIYLDNNATTFIDPLVLEVMVNSMNTPLGNPSSIHYYGQEAKVHMVNAREKVAKFLNVKPSEIIFTSGATEAINTAVKGFCMEQKEKGQVISSCVEHAAMNDSLKELELNGWDVLKLPVGSSGSINPEDLDKSITDKTKLIAIMAVNNETGAKNDVEAIAEIALKHNVPLFIDAVAWLGKERIHIPKGVSALCFSGHKMHAPKGVGVLYAKPRYRFRSLLSGGGQEYGRRGGTENIFGIIAMSKAIQLLDENQESYTDHMLKLRDLFESLLKEKLSGVQINGDGNRVCNTSNVSFEGVEGESLLMNLDLAGIAASHGSACAAGALEPSHVLINMGIEREMAQSAVRFAFSRFNTEEEVKKAVTVIEEVVLKLRELVKLK